MMLLFPPSEEAKQVIKKKLYQHPDKTAQDILYLKEWIKKQPHLPQDTDDIMLDRFLYTCEFSLEKCKKMIEIHYTLRSCLPSYFTNFDPTSSEIRNISQVCYRIALPHCTSEGYRVTMFGLLDADVSKTNVLAVIRRDFLFFTSLINLESIYGLISIYDAREFSMSHASEVIPHLNNIAVSSKDTAPMRIKQLHFIYVSPALKNVLQIISPLLKPKIRERIHIHTDDLSTLYKFIPQEMFPSDFGGKAGSIRELNDAWQKQVESMKDWVAKELNRKADETKRPKDSTKNDLFGMEGSFKTLNID